MVYLEQLSCYISAMQSRMCTCTCVSTYIVALMSEMPFVVFLVFSPHTSSSDSLLPHQSQASDVSMTVPINRSPSTEVTSCPHSTVM